MRCRETTVRGFVVSIFGVTMTLPHFAHNVEARIAKSE